jgi:O-antigen/teichoic acid export membrane protein
VSPGRRPDAAPVAADVLEGQTGRAVVPEVEVSTSPPAATSGDGGGPGGGGGSMQRRVVSGASWSAAGRLGGQGLQFLAGLVLARLLFPEDFGLLASVYVITGLTVIFFDMGLSQALVHRRTLDDRVMSTAFWFNAVGGLLFVGLLTLLGPLVADFFGDDRLRWITPLAGLSFALSLAVVHSALLQRDLRFKPLALTEVGAGLVNHSATVTAAALGMGPWALLVGPPLQSLVVTGVLWRLTGWRPRLQFSGRDLRGLWAFSGGMLGFGVVNYAGRNMDNLLVGRFVGAAGLGLYNRAYNLMLLPLQQVGGVLGRVMFPALTAMGDDLARVRAAYRRALRLMSFLTIPLLVGMAATAPALVAVLWGDRWEGTVPLLQLLCLAGLPQALSSSEGWLYQSQGRTTLMFGMGLVSTLGTVVAISVGLQHGVVGVAAGVLVSAYVVLPVNLFVACRVVGLASWRVYADNARTVVSAALMGGAVWGLPHLLDVPASTGWLLPAQVALGVLVYLLLALLLQRPLLVELRHLRGHR